MSKQGEDSQRLDVLTRRADVLRHLCTETAHKRDLVDEMDLSRSTINRAISELQDVDFVEKTGDGVTATLAGRLAVERLDTFRTEVSELVSADAVVDPLPVDASLTTAAVVGAEAVLATEPMPYQPLERVHEELSDAARYRALVPVLDDPRHVRLLYEHVVTDDQEADLVVTPSVFETLREEFPRRMAAMADADGFRVRVTDTLPPFGLAMFERNGDSTIAVVVFTDSGIVHGALVNDAAAAFEWATDRFEAVARGAVDRTDELVADTDGGTVTQSGPKTQGLSLPVVLEREGFVRLDTAYFRDEPVADPVTAWRAGLSLTEVHTGYAVERTHSDVSPDTQVVAETLESTLADGSDCVVVGPPGAGKSTLCKRVACRWYETDRGAVLYREQGRGRSFDSVAALVDAVRRDDGQTLVVVEDAVRAEIHDVFAAQERLADAEDVCFLFDSRESEWLHPPRDLDVPDLAVQRVPRLAQLDCERLVEQFEQTVGKEVDIPTERLWEWVREETRAEDAEVGGMLLLLHRLGTYADPLAEDQTTLEAEMASLIAELANDDTALSVCVLANTLNAAGLGIDRDALYAVADPGEFAAVDDALDRLEGHILFERPDGSYRTVHDAWSVTLLAQLPAVLGDERARALFGDVVTALLSLAVDQDQRDRIRAHLDGGCLRSSIEGAPRTWLADTVELLVELGQKRPKLAPLYGDGEYDSIDLPAACPAETRDRWPMWLGQLFLAGGYYERAERAFHRLSLTDSDTAVERLLGLAQVATETGDYEEAVELAEECLARTDADSQLVRARATLTAGRALNNRGEYGAASDRLQTALEGFEALDDRRRMVTALNELGRAAREQGSYEDARGYLQRSLDISRELGDRESAGSSHAALGAAVFGLGDYDRAREHFEWALDIARKRGDRGLELDSLKWTGTVAMYVSEYDRAAEYYERALDVARELGNPRREAEILGTRGLLAERVGEYDSAREYLHRGLDLATEIGNSRSMAARHNNLGLVAVRLGEHDCAHEQFETGLEVAREYGHRRHEANALNGLGHVATMCGHYEQARQYHEDALAITRDIESRRRIADSYNKLGRVARLLEEYDRARERYQDALDIARDLDTPREIAKSLTGLGELDRICGEYDQSHDRIETALEYIETTGAGIETTHVRLAAARLALDRGEYERARDLGETVRDAYRAVEATQWLGRCQRLLGRVAAEHGDVETAREYWESALATFEDVDAPQDDLETLRLLVEYTDDTRTHWRERIEACVVDAPDVALDSHEWVEQP